MTGTVTVVVGTLPVAQEAVRNKLQPPRRRRTLPYRCHQPGHHRLG